MRQEQDDVRQEGRLPSRTGTRPPHPLHPSPCPYSEGSGRCPLLPVLVVNIHNRRCARYIGIYGFPKDLANAPHIKQARSSFSSWLVTFP